MNQNEFIKLVLDMRTMQKQYFKSRGQEALIASKQLEGEVDKAIKHYQEKSKPQLFTS